MKHLEQPVQNLPATVIEDPNLAEAMAYGQKGQVESAQQALRVGEFTQAAGHLAIAETAATDAGKAFVRDEQARVDKLRAQINGDTSPADTGTLEELLTPEKREQAGKWRAALVEKYAEYGVSADDFEVLQTTGKNGEATFELMLTADEGIDLGDPDESYDQRRSWNSIDPDKPDQRFMVEVDGQEIDTRSGVTLAALRTLAEHNPKISEYVWRIGEKELAGGRDAPIADVDDGQVVGRWSHRDGDGRGIRFRPAVVIE